MNKLNTDKAPQGARGDLGWTEDRVAVLVDLHEKGYSFGQIAPQLGVSRNAAIGKARRLGLSARSDAFQHTSRLPLRGAKSKPRTDGAKTPQTRKAKTPTVQAAAENPAEAPPNPARANRSTERQCRWPIGDPALASFGWCGNYREGGSSYCREHKIRGVRPSKVSAKELARGLRRYT